MMRYGWRSFAGWMRGVWVGEGGMDGAVLPDG